MNDLKVPAIAKVSGSQTKDMTGGCSFQDGQVPANTSQLIETAYEMTKNSDPLGVWAQWKRSDLEIPENEETKRIQQVIEGEAEPLSPKEVLLSHTKENPGKVLALIGLYDPATPLVFKYFSLILFPEPYRPVLSK